MALRPLVKYSYGVGHIFNDLCGSMWFTYLLVYLHYVLQLSRSLSGFLFMIGQVCDAIATPLIGLQSDRGQQLCGYGRRKTWHALGSVCVLFTFPFIFIKCWRCFAILHSGYILLITLAICVFQFGWASVQVSHLALSLDLVERDLEREELNLIRYIFYVSSEVTVSFIAWVTFSSLGTTGEDTLTPGDAYSFKVITITILFMGLLFSIAFHIITPEPPTPRRRTRTPAATHYHRGTPHPTTHRRDTQDDAPPIRSNQREWQDWLRDPQFYKVCLLYTSSRLISNLATIYTPIYVAETLREKTLIALIPLVMALAGVLASFLYKLLKTYIGKKGSLVVGVLVGVCGCAVAALPNLSAWVGVWLAVLWGVAGALLVVITLGMASRLIGENTDTSAFVYGGLSFADKITNGLVVLLIQELTRIGCNGDDCSTYYRWVMSIGLLVPLFMAIVALLWLYNDRIYAHLYHNSGLVTQDDEGEGLLCSSSVSSSSDSLLLGPGVTLGYGSVTRV